MFLINEVTGRMLKLVIKVRQKKANDLLEGGIEGGKGRKGEEEKKGRGKERGNVYWNKDSKLKIKLASIPEGSKSHMTSGYIFFNEQR